MMTKGITKRIPGPSYSVYRELLKIFKFHQQQSASETLSDESTMLLKSPTCKFTVSIIFSECKPPAGYSFADYQPVSRSHDTGIIRCLTITQPWTTRAAGNPNSNCSLEIHAKKQFFQPNFPGLHICAIKVCRCNDS